MTLSDVKWPSTFADERGGGCLSASKSVFRPRSLELVHCFCIRGSYWSRSNCSLEKHHVSQDVPASKHRRPDFTSNRPHWPPAPTRPLRFSLTINVADPYTRTHGLHLSDSPEWSSAQKLGRNDIIIAPSRSLGRIHLAPPPSSYGHCSSLCTERWPTWLIFSEPMLTKTLCFNPLIDPWNPHIPGPYPEIRAIAMVVFWGQGSRWTWSDRYMCSSQVR